MIERPSLGGGGLRRSALVLRYRQAGLRVVWAEDVFVHHFWEQSFGTLEQCRYDPLPLENKRNLGDQWHTEWEPYR